MSDSSDQVVLVTGATGNTGLALLRRLEDREVAVRAMVRRESDLARLGPTSASVVVADFDDARSIQAALRGISRVYLVTPSSAEAETQQVRFAEQAAAAGVEHLVKLSQRSVLQFARDYASAFRSEASTSTS
ncbi:NAD(P)H-binding protein [Singulisphaera sp. Ch08]|uniref:NAD(P)H-binding protein n=1 Tax=Singulisphaera sp. Ch08 TaxID=3120278 RepID=A0AAU7CMA4_9BACT